MKVDGKAIALRDRRKPGHGWYDNEIYDVFGDELRQDGISVYMTLTRLCYGTRVTMSLREMATHARMSKDTFARNLKRVIGVGLVIEHKGATAQSASTYELVDVKELAGEYLRKLNAGKVSQGETGSEAPKKISPDQIATEVSQNEGDFATEVSQDVRHPLSQGLQDFQDTKTSTPSVGSQGNRVVSISRLETAPETARAAMESPGWSSAKHVAELLTASLRVLAACGVTEDARLQDAIANALEAHCRREKCTLKLAEALALENVKAYLQDQHLMRVRYGWVNFFKQGLWLSASRWPYDKREVERLRRRL